MFKEYEPMPIARPPLSPESPMPLKADEAEFIEATIRQFYGPLAVVRNFGSSPSSLDLHVETEKTPGLERYDCLGILMTRIARDAINLVVTKRGSRISGQAKLAYRQGVIL